MALRWGILPRRRSVTPSPMKQSSPRQGVSLLGPTMLVGALLLMSGCLSSRSGASAASSSDPYEAAVILEAVAQVHEQYAMALEADPGLAVLDLVPEPNPRAEVSSGVDVVALPVQGETAVRALSDSDLDRINELNALIAGQPGPSIAATKQGLDRVWHAMEALDGMGVPLPMHVASPASRPRELSPEWRDQELGRAAQALERRLRGRALALNQESRRLVGAAGKLSTLAAGDTDYRLALARKLAEMDRGRITAEVELAFAAEWISILKSRLDRYPDPSARPRMTFIPPTAAGVNLLQDFRVLLDPREGSRDRSSDSGSERREADRLWGAMTARAKAAIKKMRIEPRDLMVRDHARTAARRWFDHLTGRLEAAQGTAAWHASRLQRLGLPVLLKSSLMAR